MQSFYIYFFLKTGCHICMNYIQLYRYKHYLTNAQCISFLLVCFVNTFKLLRLDWIGNFHFALRKS